MININVLRTNRLPSQEMKTDLNDAEGCLRKAEEYREKARATDDPRVKSALEAVAREFTHKARACGASPPRAARIR